MIDVKKVYEDAVVGAGLAAMAADVQAAPGAISDVDILGHCDHNKEGGYMKDGCFHLPKGAMPLQKRDDEIFAGKKKKNQKNDYIKGMKVINEAELDRDTILAIHKVKESALRNYILKFFKDEIYDGMYVQAIAYFPPAKSFFIKVENDGKWSFVNLDFKNGKFVITDDLNVYTSQDIKREYLDKVGSNMKVWVVWGGL